MTRRPRSSKFTPTRQLSRLRKLRNLMRNLWILRGELWAIIRRKQEKQPEPVALVCIRCRHELTKPCKRGFPKHVIRWPDGQPGFEPGTLVEVRRQKVRAGQYEKDYDLKALEAPAR